MSLPASFPPPVDDSIGRMRYFAAACLAQLVKMRGLLYFKGQPWLEHTITGARTLDRAIGAVGKVRGGARWVLLRVHVCVARLEQVRCYACRLVARMWFQALLDLRCIELAARAWMRAVALKLNGGLSS